MILLQCEGFLKESAPIIAALIAVIGVFVGIYFQSKQFYTNKESELKLFYANKESELKQLLRKQR